MLLIRTYLKIVITYQSGWNCCSKAQIAKPVKMFPSMHFLFKVSTNINQCPSNKDRYKYVKIWCMDVLLILTWSSLVTLVSTLHLKFTQIIRQEGDEDRWNEVFQSFQLSWEQINLYFSILAALTMALEADQLLNQSQKRHLIVYRGSLTCTTWSICSDDFQE